MEIIKGALKTQHGVMRIYEMIEVVSHQASEGRMNVIGYAIFDLEDQMIGAVVRAYQDVLNDLRKVDVA